MKVAIIGLGLIGGSIARRLRGFHNCTISAYNRTSETVLLAKAGRCNRRRKFGRRRSNG